MEIKDEQHWIQHLYGVLQEEAAELIMAVSKHRRFGGNIANINVELNDVLAVAEMLATANEALESDVAMQRKKEAKVELYYPYSFTLDCRDDAPDKRG